MILHVTKGNDRGLTAKLDIIEQNVKGLIVSAISIKDSKLNFAVDLAQVKYEARVDAGVTSIQGNWMQANQTFAMDFERPAAGSDPAIAGAGQILDLVFQDKYADLVSTLSPQLRATAGLTEDKIRDEIRKVRPPMGAVLKRLDATLLGEGAQQTVVIPVQFETGTVDFTIILNSAREVDHLFFRPVEQAKVELANVNHVFKEVEGVPNPAADYTDPDKPFSREAGPVITEFIRATLLP